jgi:hypothetical protein
MPKGEDLMSLSAGLIGGAQGAGKKSRRRNHPARMSYAETVKAVAESRDAAEAKEAYARADAWAKSAPGTKYGEVPK